MSVARKSNLPLSEGLAQIGACGIFLFQILRAIPRSLRHVRETVRQIFFVGGMSLVIIMTCGLFVGMVLGLQLYHTLSIFGGTAEYIALWFKSIGMETGYYWYVTACIAVSLLVYITMKDTRKHSRIETD